MYIKSFSCLWRTFNIFWKASLLAMNSFSFCLSEKVCISPSLLRNNFSGYRILDWWFFLLTFYIFHTLFLLHGFQGEVGYNYYLCSSVGKVFLSSKFFPSGFFLKNLWFSVVRRWYAYMLLFFFLTFNPVWCCLNFLNLWFFLCQTSGRGKSWSLFYQMFLLLLFPSSIPSMHVLTFCSCPTVLAYSLLFFCLCYLRFGFQTFWWCIH